MYTVLRFSATEHALQAVRELVDSICDAGQCSEIRNSTFSCDISDSDTWDVHMGAIEAFLNRIGAILPKVRKCEMQLHISLDIAIEPEDRGDRLYVPLIFSRTFLDRLVQAEIELEVTSYV